ncbi:hypothetical protein PS15p_207072 [Mucor circinelloides]
MSLYANTLARNLGALNISLDNIIESAALFRGKDVEEGYDTDGSCRSEDYHPRRTRNYSVDAVCEDDGSSHILLL